MLSNSQINPFEANELKSFLKNKVKKRNIKIKLKFFYKKGNINFYSIIKILSKWKLFKISKFIQ